MSRGKGVLSRMRQHYFTKVVGLVTVLWIVSIAFGGDMATEAPIIRVSVTFNNVAYDTHLRTSWGFSSLIEGTEKTILFDYPTEGIMKGEENEHNT